jgi:mRNA-degrading endonuclease RelE of RelBE toxin-antitoxin system
LPNKVVFTPRAEKDLERVSDVTVRRKIEEVVRGLSDDLSAGETLTGSMNGARALKFSTRQGEYRVAYVAQHVEHLAVVFLIGPRENFYETAKRRFRSL